MTFNCAIVENMFWDLLFNPEESNATMSQGRYLSIFHMYEDAAPYGYRNIDYCYYYININSFRLFNMVIGFVLKQHHFVVQPSFFWLRDWLPS